MPKGAATLNGIGSKEGDYSDIISDIGEETSLGAAYGKEGIARDDPLLQEVFTCFLVEEGVALDDINTRRRDCVLDNVQCRTG